MASCNKFQCKNQSNNICKYSGNKCNVDCNVFYAKCFVCVSPDCVFKELYKHKYRNLISYTDRRERQPSCNYEENIKIHSNVAYAYVDGSYNPYTKTYGYGVCLYDGVMHKFWGKGNNLELVGMRNVAGEIEGARAAIEFAQNNGIGKLRIFYDYTGIEAWATRKWRANKTGTIAYQNLCQTTNVQLEFVKVKGHSGVEGNDIADRLAKKAVGLVGDR